MNTTFTTFAIVSLITVSSASADHRDHGHQAQPIQLAHALHVQAETLEHEIEHHYPNAPGLQHRTALISRLAVSTERDIKLGHLFGAAQKLQYIDKLLHDVDLVLRRSIASGRDDGRHIRRDLKKSYGLAQSLEHALRHAHVGHHDHGSHHRHDGHGHGGGHGHDHGHGHGHRDHSQSEHVVSRSRTIHFHRSGRVCDLRTR